MLFCLIISVLSTTAGGAGAAERQRDVADIEAAETPGEGTAGAGLPLKGAVTK
mgnify:CR=1 FL=1